MAGYEGVLDSIAMDRKKNIQGQISLFDAFGGSEETSQLNKVIAIPKIKEFEEREKLNLEKEVLGMYVSGHPLSQFEEELQRNTSIDIGKINSLKEDEEVYLSLDEREVIMGGMIATKNIKTTKRNEIMAFLELEDLYGTIEVIVFPQLLKKYSNILNEDSIIYVKGNLNIKEDENPKIVAREISDINHKVNNSKTGLYLKIDSFNNTNLVNEIIKIGKKYPGQENVFFYAEQNKQLCKYNGLSVNCSQELINSLETILPKENIKIKI